METAMRTKDGSSRAAARKQRGQGMSEYIIITALVAVAGIGLFAAFGDVLQNQMAGMSREMAGQSASQDISDAQALLRKTVPRRRTACPTTTSRLMRPNKSHWQRGQIAPVALFGVLIASAVLVVMFNTGQKVMERSLVANAADAAAYSGAVWTGRPPRRFCLRSSARW